jgi:hypothetical protein
VVIYLDVYSFNVYILDVCCMNTFSRESSFGNTCGFLL